MLPSPVLCPIQDSRSLVLIQPIQTLMQIWLLVVDYDMFLTCGEHVRLLANFSPLARWDSVVKSLACFLIILLDFLLYLCWVISW